VVEATKLKSDGKGKQAQGGGEMNIKEDIAHGIHVKEQTEH